MSSVYIQKQELAVFRKWPSNYFNSTISMEHHMVKHIRCRCCDFEIDEITPYREKTSIEIMSMVVKESFSNLRNLDPIGFDAVGEMRKTKDRNWAILNCKTKNAYIHYACEEVLDRNPESVKEILDGLVH
jgi:hypothetical protein